MRFRIETLKHEGTHADKETKQKNIVEYLFLSLQTMAIFRMTMMYQNEKFSRNLLHLQICQSIDSFLLMISPCSKNEAVRIFNCVGMGDTAKGRLTQF